ncbi:hypothetical protein EDB81DRAFT_830112 [Dactylonectria macrodidyma]|uniref:Uncharacterized protein n=1 Tax=Dactylonectria macrodidyma TaxID=307937 RepID=A0A9P9I825_9HYPO|nr:hypothetical protein EDB81DRAFT_830112 [Dactylonectria macrodidyma]
MHVFKLLPLFLGLSLALPAAEADPNSLEARACTYSSCVSKCCKDVGCNGFLNCGRSTCSGGKCTCHCQYN